ncbi:glyoxylase-like metal-dependent hydrolase (beta-lactamase superfamily II)/putative NADH-flavin reductase [Marisediminicola sp. UYEF4]|uniref:NAD(P)H-binding protein n=1 Tax=Marisediminicola sp. UYEF4 TaxID=1756384 RepID=UPI003393DB33
MIIAIFGGSGATGRILIGQALDEGHQVNALVRPAARLGIVHDRLRVAHGELSDAAAIDRAVEGADGVVSLLGQPENRAGAPIARATRNIVASMQKFGVRRLVIVARPGVHVPNDEPSVLTRLGIQATRQFRRQRYDDVVETARVVSESGLDWTIVRPLALRDGPRTGHVAVGYLGDGVTGGSLSRANAADFMLELAVSRQYIGRAPVVSDVNLSSDVPPAPVQIAPGVYCLRLGVGITSTNVYFVRSGAFWVLIDTAGPNHAHEIRSAAETIFGTASRPAAILLTHLHATHAGSARELARHWGLPVQVHPAERPLVSSGYRANEYPTGLLNRITTRMMSAQTRELDLGSIVHAFDPDDGVPGLPDWQCIATPGHTPGHASFFRPADRVLISGDAVLTVNLNSPAEPSRHRQQVSGPPRFSTWDRHDAAESMERLARLEPRVLAAGHGIPMIGDEVAPALLSFSAEARQLAPSRRSET